MAQEPVLRPFGKADFGHQLRLEPGRLLVRPRLRRVLERRVGALQAGDGPFQLVRLGCSQARTHAADVAEPAVVVGAEQQRAHARAVLLGARVAADDELLAMVALQFDPVAVARTAVGSRGALAHHALEAQLAGGVKAVLAPPAHVAAVAYAGGRAFQQLLEHFLALEQGAVPQVRAFKRQQVEHEVGGLRAAGVAQEVLEGLEVGAAVSVDHRHLSVQHEHAAGGPVGKLGGDGGEMPGVVLAVAADQPRAVLLHEREHAVAVVLHLVHPPVALRRRRHELRQLHVGAVEGVARKPPVAAGRYLVHGAARAHARAEAGDAGLVLHVPVLLLDEEPVVSVLARLGLQPHEHPGALEAPAVQHELQLAVAQARLDVAERFPEPLVPEHHRAAAVLALRNGSLEVAVLQRMVLHVHGQPLVARVVRGPLGHRPAQQHPVPFQAQVVVVAAGQVVLHEEPQAPRGLAAHALRLGGSVEIALLVVGAQLRGHGGYLRIFRVLLGCSIFSLAGGHLAVQ